jgi:tRNA (cmo5U34)-methyltransferase
MIMNRIKHHFETEAQAFDDIILKLIPHYPVMLRALADAIPFERSMPVRAIDLGSGTGTLAALILEAFPHARVTCVDLAENMISAAKTKLARYPSVEYIVADFYGFDFRDKYDVIASSLALHHLLTDKDKQDFYRRIYESLNPGGVFYNADVVLASNQHLQSLYLSEWRKFMNRKVSKKEIEGKWIPKYQEEDRPAKLVNQLAWLSGTGFVDVDVIWKYFNFAVYGGARR